MSWSLGELQSEGKTSLQQTTSHNTNIEEMSLWDAYHCTSEVAEEVNWAQNTTEHLTEISDD